VPRLKNWALSIGNSYGKIDFEGDFKKLGDIQLFYDSALSLLRDVQLTRRFYVFLDELEISFTSSNQFANDVKAAAALIKEVRDLNEFLRGYRVPIFIICAVRKEVSQKILGQDAAKIVRDLGYELSWQRPAWSKERDSYYHPLFEIVLRRIHASEKPRAFLATWGELGDIEKRYFDFRDQRWSQRAILDLTTYRPRDIPVLFSRAKQFDGPKERFSKNTFFQLVRKGYREDLWSDFAEALRTEYSQEEVSLFKRVYFALPNYFRIKDLVQEADDFSADPLLADLIYSLDRRKWTSFLNDLYQLGAVGWSSLDGEEESVHFHFRGDTDGLEITKSNWLVKPQGLRQTK
jgi:hypothetical protein